jgi:hypothetical protein
VGQRGKRRYHPTGRWSPISTSRQAAAWRSVALAIVAELEGILGTQASIVVNSGGGLHIYWHGRRADR